MPELSEEFQTINREWVNECETALQACPAEFTQTFIQIMFLGQRLITETRVSAEINGAKEEMLRRFGLGLPLDPAVQDAAFISRVLDGLERESTGITCPECQQVFPDYPTFTAHIGNPTCASQIISQP